MGGHLFLHTNLSLPFLYMEPLLVLMYSSGGFEPSVLAGLLPTTMYYTQRMFILPHHNVSLDPQPLGRRLQDFVGSVVDPQFHETHSERQTGKALRLALHKAEFCVPLL